MGYRIIYDGSDSTRSAERGWLSLAAGILFLLGVIFFWDEGRAVLWEFLLPGAGERVEPALQTFAAEAAAGESLWDSLTGFFSILTEGVR